ncbi:hypothetical protein OG985_28690 [Streptomyces sp. NBC_00289]|uniref:hypothetical protein n=1 Tax=Streptomyces sp. NBC_00289 TaxID=2975703 RepID=UPI003253B502
MSYTQPATLSDGATVRVRVERGLTDDAVFHEQNSNNPNGGGRIYWSGQGLYLMWGGGEREQMLRMQDPRFESADSIADAAAKALAFFTQCAEGCIRHAQAEGIPVRACYAA